jgi:D-amino-acid dehydrogenase
MRSGKAVVVGAGIVGASTAYELALRGWEVELIDRGGFGAGSSAGNCGYICPSHVFPLAKPGAIAATLPLILQRNSPFMIRPRLDLSLITWLARFASCCRADLVERTSHALNDLSQSSKACYQRIIAAEKLECDWEDIGCLFISHTPEHMDAFEKDNQTIRSRFGFGADRLDGAQLAAMEPTLREDLGGAWYFQCDAHLRPDRFMAALKPVLERRGVRVHEHRAATGLEGDDGKATRLLTESGPIEADAFVFAAGAWTPKLSKALGIRLAIQPGKGYSITAKRPRSCPKYPMIFEEHRVAVTPWASGFRVGSMMEFAGYDESIRPERLGHLTRSSALYFREWDELDVEQSWYGWRPMTPDGRPFVGPTPKHCNVWVAAGHNMIGMSTGPATGRLVAEMMSGEETHIDPRPFDPTRETW